VTALGGLLFLAFRRRPLDLLLLLAVLSFYAVGSLGNSAFFRYMLPLVPFLCLAAAALLVRLFGTRPGWQVGLLAVLLLSSTLVSSIRFDTLIAQTDTRLQAADWISRNVPSGSGIALEGMHFGYPRLFTARRWLEDELADFRAAGKDGRRLERMLALKTYPPEPNYYVVEMRPEEFFPRRVICESCTLEKLREKEVGWVVLQDHPVARPLPDPAFREALEREAVLVASFDPARKKEGHAEYDLIDAFYAPLAGFEAVERSGPRLRIYRLD
jgi:hypothetical protein